MRTSADSFDKRLSRHAPRNADGDSEQRGPTPVAAVLASSALFAAGLVDLPRLIQVGPITSLAVITAVVATGAMLLLLGDSRWPMSLVRPVWVAWAFFAWAALSMLWASPTRDGLQNQLVLFTALAVSLLTAVVTFRDSRAGIRLLGHLRLAGVLGCSVFVVTSFVVVTRANAAASPRSFALFAMVALAGELSGWDQNRTRSRFVSLVIMVVVLASLARTALAICLLLVWLSQLRPGSVRARLRFSIAGGLLLVISVLGVTRFQPLQERFSQGDLSLRVGSLMINAEGRTNLWTATLTSWENSRIVGLGAGSASNMLQVQYGIFHPHNDYLRVLHDYGIVGLSVWVLALIQLFVGARQAWIDAHGNGDVRALSIHRAAYFAVLALIIAMMTDNPLAYYMVLVPIGILIGSSIGVRLRARFVA